MKILNKYTAEQLEEKASSYACIALQLSKRRLKEFLNSIDKPILRELTVNKLIDKVQLINAQKYALGEV